MLDLIKVALAAAADRLRARAMVLWLTRKYEVIATGVVIVLVIALLARCTH